MESGPVFIAGRCFVVQPWTPEVEAQRERVDAVPIWIKICNLPKLLWSDSGISYAASLISEPLKMDKITTERSRVDFARVCIIVGPNQQLPLKVPVNVGYETSFDVEYNWIPLSCFHCNRFGHSFEKCDSVKRQWVPKNGASLADEQLAGASGKVMTESARVPVAWAGTNPAAPNVSFVRHDTEDSSGGGKSPNATQRAAVETDIVTSVNRFDVLSDESTEEDTDEGDAQILEQRKDVNPALPTGKDRAPTDSSISMSAPCGQQETNDNSVVGVEDGTGSFLHDINSCLDICQTIVASTIQNSLIPDMAKMETSNQKDSLLDKGGTIDPSNPETWTEAMRQADKQIALVKARMENPELITEKPMKVNLKVKLVKGHSGAPIRSLLRNKR